MSKIPTHLFKRPDIGFSNTCDGSDLDLDKNVIERRSPFQPQCHKEAQERSKTDFVSNSKPPTRQQYDPRNLSKGVKGWEEHCKRELEFDTNDRPISARSTRSMAFSLHESRPPSATSMRSVLKEARHTKDDTSSNFVEVAQTSKKKKFAILLTIVLVAVSAVVVTVTVLEVQDTFTTTRRPPLPTTTTTTTTKTTTLPTRETETESFQTGTTATQSEPITESIVIPTDLRRHTSDLDETHSPLTTEATSTSSVPSVIVVEDNTDIAYGGSWLAWESWSDCSLSCASGFQQRIRTCGSEELQCQGVNTQQQRCNTELCPLEEPEGVWTTWLHWSECDVSCGTGIQIRTRSCVSINDTDILSEDCIGVANQTRTCNTFHCPDCSQMCSEGVLESCTYCECSNTVTGQVLGSDNLPLSNATIAPSNAPYVILHISTPGGYFTVSGICFGDTYIFEKDGYLDADVIFTNPTQNVTMERFVNLQMVSNPQDVMAISGIRIELCCEVYGVPPPDYYEWMKNGDVEITSTESTFAIEAASVEDTGYYNCRASNDYSAVYSSTSKVLVKESSDDFCALRPQSNRVALPNGCRYDNSTTIDRGQCESNSCYGGESEGCIESTSYCCGPIHLTAVRVDCEHYILPIYLITECGCTVCQNPRLTVYGFAGSRGGDPLQYGDIYWNGTIIANTSDDGTFSFTVDRGVSRASILFVDTQNMTFMDSNYVFEMPRSNIESQYVRAVLFKRGQTIYINASEESNLEINGTSIHIPPESFYTEDGQPYAGEVIASLTAIDPTNIDEMTSAPGDFSTLDEEGDSQQLLSFGMFAMVFEDSSGDRLSIPGEITITITQEILGDTNDTSSVRVWSLNPSTGLWEFASNLEEVPENENDMRRKRQINRRIWGQTPYQATIRGIPINVRWFNFDAISTQTCIVKVRLFENDRFYESAQIYTGRVSVVVQDSNGYNSLSSYRVSTDTGRNGYCMVLPCTSRRSRNNVRFRGFIFMLIMAVMS